MRGNQLTTPRGAPRADVAPPVAAPAAPAPPPDRVLRWALWAFFAVLPLQWFFVPGIPLGPLRLHLLAIVAFTGFVVVRYRAPAWLPALRTALPVVLAAAVFVVVWAGVNVFHALPLRGPLQEAVQLVALVAVGTVVFRAASRPSTRVLEAARWTALVAAVSLLVALSLSMAANGVNPGAVFARSIAAGDPVVLQRELFRSAFAGYGIAADEVQGNIRHEVFGAVLTAMCLSSAAARLRPFGSARAAAAYRASMVLGAALVVVSLSRSTTLAAAAWVLLAVVTQARRFGLSGRQLGVLAGALVGVGVAVLTGFASVVLNRFTEDTASYEGRNNLLAETLAAIPDHLWTGGADPSGASSHVFVIDSVLRAGVLGGLAALAVVLLVLAQFVQLAVRLPVEPAFMLPVTAALALPLVRFFTAGGGVIPPVQYVGLGIVAGFLAYRMTLSRTPPGPRSPRR